MCYISVALRGMSAHTGEQLLKVLGLMNDGSAGPVFVHCRRGADRTGTVVACYRISHDGWQNPQALREAKQYGMSMFDRAMHYFVLHYQPVTAVNAAAPQPATSTPAVVQ